jgi:hypothetical protein
MILNYALGLLSFMFGMTIHILGKVQEFKQIAEANNDPSVTFSYKKLFNKEWINFVRAILGGIAIIIFLPMFIGDYKTQFVNHEGVVMFTVALKALLIPLHFFIGYSGSSAVFNILGKYKKDLLSNIGGNG